MHNVINHTAAPHRRPHEPYRSVCHAHCGGAWYTCGAAAVGSERATRAALRRALAMLAPLPPSSLSSLSVAASSSSSASSTSASSTSITSSEAAAPALGPDPRLDIASSSLSGCSPAQGGGAESGDSLVGVGGRRRHGAHRARRRTSGISLRSSRISVLAERRLRSYCAALVLRPRSAAASHFAARAVESPPPSASSSCPTMQTVQQCRREVRNSPTMQTGVRDA